MPTDWRFKLLLVIFTFPISVLFLLALGMHAATTRVDRLRRLPDAGHWLIAVAAVTTLVGIGVYVVNSG